MCLLQGGPTGRCQQLQAGRLGEWPLCGGRSSLCLFSMHPGSFQHDLHLANHRCGFRWLQGGPTGRCQQQPGRLGGGGHVDSVRTSGIDIQALHAALMYIHLGHQRS